MAEYQQAQQQNEFLPLCDVLFNIISLASYFCDIVFDLAMAYAFAKYSPSPPIFFPLSMILIVTSLVVSQVVSIRWYLWGPRGKMKNDNNSCDINKQTKTVSWAMACVMLFHTTQIGVLWRYFKLFIPVDLAYVKHEVRELCILRLIHAFCEAAPMLLLQTYFLTVCLKPDPEINEINRNAGEPSPEKMKELTTVSAGLSLWSVCWAVASFSKGAARLRNLERLVLTWLGVLAQLAWRLGTVSARVGALIAYASIYGGQWMIVVMVLHWFTMFTWLMLTPDGLFHSEERITTKRKLYTVSLLAFIYIFSYINLHETNHRQKMLIFYCVMFLENMLLISVWAISHGSENSIQNLNEHTNPSTFIPMLLALFVGGLLFMGLYYRFFHIQRLKYEAGGRMNSCNSNSNQNVLQEKNIYNIDKQNNAIGLKKIKLNNGGIPGVFNCRFTNPNVMNPKRKKKKPTTFVPPPINGNIIPLSALESNKWCNANNVNGPQLIPFWKRPLSVASLNNEEDLAREKNEAEIMLGSSISVNLIHEKLKEKKQQQLRELRAIQKEMREGKLIPPPASTSSFSTDPPPNTKQHTTPNPIASTTVTNNLHEGTSAWPPIKMHCMMPTISTNYYHHPINITKKSPNRDVNNSEIRLAPCCLPYHYIHEVPMHLTNNRLNNEQSVLRVDQNSLKDPNLDDDLSDLDGSQISLPRSYTLPREFKYVNNERRRPTKFNNPRYQPPSNNSSDGDVDSADNEDETDIECNRPKTESSLRPPGYLQNNHFVRSRSKHETKL